MIEDVISAGSKLKKDVSVRKGKVAVLVTGHVKQTMALKMGLLILLTSAV